LGNVRGDAALSRATMSPPLAAAFLSLADDDAFVDQRTRPRIFAAAVAAVALALGAPLGFAAMHRSEHPVAALGSKFSLSSDEE
jgi:hypothetical protein